MADLPRFDFGWRSFHKQLACHHESQPVALLGLLEVVRRHQDGGARIGQTINHHPKSAAGQRIDSRCRLIEKHNAGKLHA